MRKLKNSELKRLSVDEFKAADKMPVIIILDNIRSLNNIGSVFRTADAFKIKSIHLCGITAKPPHKDIHKTALGATDSVDWKYFINTNDSIDYLKKNKYTIFAVEQAEESISLEKFNPTPFNKIALVFGNEIKGVSNEIMEKVDGCIEIPQFGTKHSLNISVSTGIIIWDLFIKLKKT